MRDCEIRFNARNESRIKANVMLSQVDAFIKQRRAELKKLENEKMGSW